MSDLDKKPFLPSKTEVIQLGSTILVAILHLMYHISWLIPLSLMFLIPAGDGWQQVALRLLVFSMTFLIHNQLLKCKRTFFRWLLGSFVSEDLLEAYDPFVPEPTSMKAAMLRNWHWLILAAMMLPIVSGMLDFQRPWANPNHTSGRHKVVRQLLEWLRTNPNTTLSLAWFLIVASLVVFALRVWRGWLRQARAAKEA